MNYWLCITNEENWKVVKEKNIWGVSRKKDLENVRVGDVLVLLSQTRKNPRRTFLIKTLWDI